MRASTQMFWFLSDAHVLCDPPPNPSDLSPLRGRCRFRTTVWPASWSGCAGRSTGWKWSRCATATRRCWTMRRTSWRSVARSRTCCATSRWRLPSLCPPRSNTWASPRWTSTPGVSHCVETSNFSRVTSRTFPSPPMCLCWQVGLFPLLEEGVFQDRAKGDCQFWCPRWKWKWLLWFLTLAWHAWRSVGMQACRGTHP